MYYRKDEAIDGLYSVCTEKFDESFVKKSDSLFAKGFDGGTYLKTFLSSPSDQYREREAEWKKEKAEKEARKYLADTDYVITKLSEAKLVDESEYESLLEEYAEVLAKRRECRKTIGGE